MTKEAALGSDSVEDDRDLLVPDPVIAKEFGVSLMTIFRWAHDAELGFPPAAKINGRNYRSRRAIERWKAKMMRRAIVRRSEQQPATA